MKGNKMPQGLWGRCGVFYRPVVVFSFGKEVHRGSVPNKFRREKGSRIFCTRIRRKKSGIFPRRDLLSWKDYTKIENKRLSVRPKGQPFPDSLLRGAIWRSKKYEQD